MKPSDFASVSNMGSVARKSEAETVASNIMRILMITGDEWRPLSWEEYWNQRTKHGTGFSLKEKPYFEQVIDFCQSEQTARLFAPGWKMVGIEQEPDQQRPFFPSGPILGGGAV